MYPTFRGRLCAVLPFFLLSSTSVLAQAAASNGNLQLNEISVAAQGTQPAEGGISEPALRQFAPGGVGVIRPGENSGSTTVPSVAKQREAVNSTVGSVAFVDAAQFQNKYVNTLRDVLQDTPGVFAQPRYGQEMRLSIRGSGISRGYHLRGLELLQDGIPINQADGSGDFYQNDPLAMRSVEVYRGGNALAFGGTTLGGAVNFVTPTAYTAFAPNIVRFEAGSFNTFRESFQFSRISGPADFLISASATNSDGYRDHETQLTRNINANFGYKIAPGVETRFYFGHYFTDQKLPGSLTMDQALTTPRKADTFAVLGNQSRRIENDRIANRTSFELDVGKLNIDSWAIHSSLYHPIFQVIDQDGWTYGVSPNWSGTFDIGGFRNDLLLGMRAFAGVNSALRFVNVAGRRGAPTDRALQSASNYEVFGENRFWFLPTVALMTGAKAFTSNRTYSNKGGVAGNPFGGFANKTYEGVNPKVGLIWQPVPTVQFFGDIARSADVPDFNDLAQFNPAGTTFVPLKLQRAWTGEIGTRGRLGRFGWDLTLYRAELRNEMVNYTVNPALNIPSATFNTPRSVHQGVEAAGSVDLATDLTGIGDRLTFTQIYTHNDFRFVNDPVFGNNRIAGIPQHVLRSVLTYAHPSGFYVSPSIDVVPTGAFADHANTLKAPGYTLFNVQTGIDFANGVSLFLDARNLTDERYIADIFIVDNAANMGGRAGLTAFYPGIGRSVFGGIRASF